MLYLHHGHEGQYSPLDSNVLVPEGAPPDAKVLLINMRSYKSDLLDPSQKSPVDQENFFVEMLNKNDDLRKEGVPPFDVTQVSKLTLSTDQTVEDWVDLARLIEQRYHEYCGFVVENGTDNMVETATALSFMMENLGKPVIFTGSLIPGHRIYSDMKRNIILALIFASCRQLCEVCILFDEKVYRANRAIKVSRSSFCPYDSPNYPPLATMSGGVLRLNHAVLRAHPHGKLRVMPHMNVKVLELRLGPGAPCTTLLRALELTTAKAVILQCYGSGNGPTRNGYMNRVIGLARKRGLLVIICTQNRYGSVSLGDYEAGNQLLKAGAIGAGDMTHEATTVKLKYLFGLGLQPAAIAAEMGNNLRGELTPPSAKL